MAEYFECIVRYERTTEAGANVKVTESYLVDAVSFGDAEQRIVEEMTPYVIGELYIVSIKRYKLSEVFIDELGSASHSDAEAQKLLGQNKTASGDADRWYRVKINFITLDEKSGKEKKSASLYLVNAGSLNAAREVINIKMKGTLADWELSDIVETKIMDVFFYDLTLQSAKEQASGIKEILGTDEDRRKIRTDRMMKAAKRLIASCPDKCKLTLVHDGKEVVIADNLNSEETPPDNDI